MKKYFIYLLHLVIGCYSQGLMAQVLSVSPGTDFDVKVGTILATDWLDFTPSTSLNLAGVSIARNASVVQSSSIAHINWGYLFSYSAASPMFGGALKFLYQESELNGLSEGGLKFVFRQGNSWLLDSGSSSDATNNTVQNTAISPSSLPIEITLGVCVPNTGDSTASACGSFNWYGTTYTTSATPTHTFTNVSGCDSVVTLHLTINPLPVVEITGNTSFCTGGSTELRTPVSHPLVFNGNGQYASMQDFGLGTNNFAIEAWLNPASYGGYIISNRTYEGGEEGNWWSIQLYNGKLTMEQSGGALGIYKVISGNSIIPLNVWTHIAVVRNGTNVKFYVNGQLDGEFTDAFLRNYSSPYNTGVIGGWPMYSAAFYNGKIDQFRIWNADRSATQILSNMNLILPEGTAGLKNNYSFEESAGNYSADKGLAANNATLYNGVSREVGSESLAITPGSSSTSTTFLWSNGATTPSITVSEAGNYTVQVTNSNGCSATSELTAVTVNPLPAIPTVSVIQPACNTGGTITVNNKLTGNSYSIDGNNYTSSGVFPDLASVTYYLSAKNVAGCISTSIPVMVNEPTGVPTAATVSVMHPTCASAYGTIRVTSTVFFNSFSIDRRDFSNLTGVFSGLPAGTYKVWVKNAAGCISAPTTLVVNPQPATPAAPVVTITHPTCTVSTGTIVINSNLGDNLYYSTNNFTYLNISGVFTGLVSGSYNVTSKNAAGCISPATPVVINPRQPIPTTPSATVIQPTCTVPTGTIMVSSPSSANTYSITRNNVTLYSTNGSFSGLASGTYSLVAISNAGCGSSAKSVVVNAPPATPAAPALSVTQPTTTLATGTIKVTSTLMGNSFSINNSAFTNLTGVFSGLVPNTYSITAKNSAGCVSLPSVVSIGTLYARGMETPAPVVVSLLPIVPAAIASDLFDVSAYPNPSSSDFRLSINSASSETIRVTVYDMFGRAVKYFSFASKSSIILGQDLKAGVYMIELRQGKHMKTLKLVKL